MPTLDLETFPVLDLLLNRDNPRHVAKQHQDEIIDYLLKHEKVYNLARSISKDGTNPLEVVAVFDQAGSTVVAEGNRRVCALQLLADPDKAPSSFKARFKALAKNSKSPSEILVMRFGTYEEARPWLQILHDGQQDGVGRKNWSAPQKARATLRPSRDMLSIELLDYAERQKILTGEQKAKVNLSTMTRYLANPKVRSAMGITTTSTTSNVAINVDDETFEKIVSKFVNDAVAENLISRSKTPEWNAYAAKISKDFSTAKKRTLEHSIPGKSGAFSSKAGKVTGKAKLKKSDNDKIEPSEAVVNALNELGSAKLSGIYGSLTSLSLSEHAALLTAGAWVFIESLTALHGRTTPDFHSYINGRLNSWGIGKEDKKEIGLSTKYISDHGNAEKHSGKFTSFDAKNLKTHFHILDGTLARIISECKK